MLGLLHLSPFCCDFWADIKLYLSQLGKQIWFLLLAGILCVFSSPKVPLPPNGQMPGFGLLPTPQFPPMAQPVMPPAAPVQPTFQSPFPVQAEPHLQKPHQQVSSPCSEQTDLNALIHVFPKCVWIVLGQKCQDDQDTAGYKAGSAGKTVG